MARKFTTAAPSKPSTKTPRGAQSAAAQGLALSDWQIRLVMLEQSNAKLLQQISKKRTELDNLVDRMQDLGGQIAQRSAPIMEQMWSIDQQIHAVFTEILTGRKLGKQTRQGVERIYRNMQISGLISPHPDNLGQSQSPDIFDFDAADFETSAMPGGEGAGSHQSSESPQQWGESAAKPDRDTLKKIRQLFLRLADIFHPDKAGADADQEYHAEVMKEINSAYQNGDLAKLLKIEQQHQVGELIDRENATDLGLRCTQIEQENEFLQSQYDALKQELRQAKASPEGLMVTEHRQLTKAGIDPIGEALAEAEEQCQLVRDVHDFVVKFRDKRITVKEFLLGPPVLQQPAMIEIDLEEVLMELLEFSDLMPPPPSRSKRHKSSY